MAFSSRVTCFSVWRLRASAAATSLLAAGAVIGLFELGGTVAASQEPRHLSPALGGDGTMFRAPNRAAFSQPMANLSFADRADFNIGNSIFRRPWVVAPSSTTSSDGLGPLYNARACQHCHQRDGRGHPPEANFPDDTALSMLVRLSITPQTDEDVALLASGAVLSLPEPTYGGQLQDLAIPGLAAEGHLWTEWTEFPVELAGGEVVYLREPTYSFADLQYGPMHPDTMLSVRVAPPMIGLGLLEAIPEAAILSQADPDDADGDGISGRPNRVASPLLGDDALGRFGWKAGTATLAEQNADAFNGDIGMSSSLVPIAYGDCTDAQDVCRSGPHGIGADTPVEVADLLMDALLFYTRTLAVPARRNTDDPGVLNGSELFASIGCVACHTPTYRTTPNAAHPALANQDIWPYSDLLLHDMGPGLADNRPEGLATGTEWRTPPLWGIGLTETVNGHTYFLHDGRARSLTEAILWHGGEAQTARDAFADLPPDDRAALIQFLEAL